MDDGLKKMFILLSQQVKTPLTKRVVSRWEIQLRLNSTTHCWGKTGSGVTDLQVFDCPKSLWICSEGHRHSAHEGFKCPHSKGQLRIQRLTDSLSSTHELYLKSLWSQLFMNLWWDKARDGGPERGLPEWRGSEELKQRLGGHWWPVKATDRWWRVGIKEKVEETLLIKKMWED